MVWFPSSNTISSSSSNNSSNSSSSSHSCSRSGSGSGGCWYCGGGYNKNNNNNNSNKITNFSNISLILWKYYTLARPAREVYRRPQNFRKFRTKNEQQRMYSSKMCHIYISSSEISPHEISRHLRANNFAAPQNVRKLNVGPKKAFDFLWFSCHVAFHVAGLYVLHVGRAHGWCLFLVPKFLEILDQNLARPVQRKIAAGLGR